MRVAITGATGFVGRNLIPNLAEQADRVLLVGRVPPEIPVRTVAASTELTDVDGLAEILAEYEIDTVIHLAGRSSAQESLIEPLDFLTTNVSLTERVFAAALRASVGTVIIPSSSEVYGPLSADQRYAADRPPNPATPYGIGKISTELVAQLYARRYSIRGLALRCGNLYGPRQQPSRLLPTSIRTTALGESVPLTGGGTAMHEWLYIEDYCDAVLNCANSAIASGVYKVSSGQSMCVHDVVSTVESMMRGDPAQLAAPGPSLLDDRAFRRATSWRPAHCFVDGLKKTLDHLAA